MSANDGVGARVTLFPLTLCGERATPFQLLQIDVGIRVKSNRS